MIILGDAGINYYLDHHDESLKEYLDRIEERLDYEQWYCGHYHVECEDGPVRVMFEDFEELY